MANRFTNKLIDEMSPGILCLGTIERILFRGGINQPMWDEMYSHLIANNPFHPNNDDYRELLAAFFIIMSDDDIDWLINSYS